MTHFVSHLEAAIDGTTLPFGQLANLHNGRPIWVRYHLDRVRAAVTPADIAKRPPSLWRYRELLPLPLDVEPVTLGEGMTPLLHCPRLGKELGLTKMDYAKVKLPVTEDILKTCLRFPVTEAMDEDYIHAVARAVRKVAKHYVV